MAQALCPKASCFVSSVEHSGSAARLPASKEVLWKNKENSQNRSSHPVPPYYQV